jgi:hypothetical protein
MQETFNKQDVSWKAASVASDVGFGAGAQQHIYALWPRTVRLVGYQNVLPRQPCAPPRGTLSCFAVLSEG